MKFRTVTDRSFGYDETLIVSEDGKWVPWREVVKWLVLNPEVCQLMSVATGLMWRERGTDEWIECDGRVVTVQFRDYSDTCPSESSDTILRIDTANEAIKQAALDLCAKRIGFSEFKHIVRENS